MRLPRGAALSGADAMSMESRTPQQLSSSGLAVQTRSIADLVPDPKNARQHPPKHIKQLAKSIEVFGFNVPILIDAQQQVIAGHGRLLAAQHLGWTEVPTITLEHLTPDQVRAYRIADNRLTDCSTWDDQLLAEQLLSLSVAELDFDLTAVGFELPEIDLRIQGLSEIEEADAGDSEVAEGPPIAQLGDLWQLGPHRVLCGNALDSDAYATLMQGESAAVVFSDPPYNVAIQGHVMGKGVIRHAEFAMASGEMTEAQFESFLSQAIAGMAACTAPGALIYLCMDWRHMGELSRAASSQGLELKNLCIWDKGVGGMGSLYRSQHELVFVFKAGDAPHTNNIQLGRFGRNRTNVWQYPGANSFARKTEEGNLLALHPTVKPIALVADVLLDASDRGDAVLDPFLGSGTTLLAAEATGRICFGMELEPKYVDVAIRRWQRKTGQVAVHAGSGETFEARAAEEGA